MASSPSRSAATAWMSRSRITTYTSPLHLDLGLVLGVEEHPVADLDRAGVRADGDDPRPGEAAGAHGGGGRDDDAAGGAALAGLAVHLDQDPVVQHLDGGLVGHGGRCRFGGGQRATLRITTNSTITPTTPPTILRMLSVRGWPVRGRRSAP